MIGLDFPKTAERLFAKWRPIHVCAAFGASLLVVVLADQFSPKGFWVNAAGKQKQYRLDHPGVFLRWRDRQDPRGFTEASGLDRADGEYGLAWISGSSISVRAEKPEQYFKGLSAYELTDVFAAQTAAIEGQPFSVHEYMIQGSRTGDMRRAVLHASNDSSISAIVMSLNPVWLYNELAVLTESNQRAAVVGMKGATLEDWLLAIGYARPSALLSAALASELNFLRSRFPISRRTLTSSKSALPYPFVAKFESEALRYPRIDDLLTGWDVTAPPEMQWIRGYRATLMRQRLDKQCRNAQFFKLLLKSLAKSEKPVLLYVAPLPRAIEHDPELLRFMKEWVAFTEGMVDRYGGDNIKLRTDTYFIAEGEISHKDIVHLHFGQGVVDKISGMMESELGLKIEKNQETNFYGETKNGWQ